MNLRNRNLLAAACLSSAAGLTLSAEVQADTDPLVWASHVPAAYQQRVPGGPVPAGRDATAALIWSHQMASAYASEPRQPRPPQPTSYGHLLWESVFPRAYARPEPGVPAQIPRPSARARQ